VSLTRAGRKRNSGVGLVSATVGVLLGGVEKRISVAGLRIFPPVLFIDSVVPALVS